MIGAGTNRMNIYTVRQATQGLANYVLSQNGQEKGVAIAYDSRRMSTEFATEVRLCFKMQMESRPTFLTACVRHRNYLCSAGAALYCRNCHYGKPQPTRV